MRMMRWGWERHLGWSYVPGAEEGMEPDDLLCSRNARSEKTLVGRAQWKINQPPSLTYNERAWGVGSRQSKEKTPATFYFLEHELSARLNSIAATFLKLLSATADTWLIGPW